MKTTKTTATKSVSPYALMTERPASGPGALAHFAYICPTCSMELASTLSTILAADISSHIAYHRRAGN